MLVWHQWEKYKSFAGEKKVIKQYRVLLLFGFIPLFIWVNG